MLFLFLCSSLSVVIVVCGSWLGKLSVVVVLVVFV